ncbi:uncharacterized protein IL334_006131 [Kwoniella shivajii]|uniref:Uncharacterized protein n=1 Tax=Kwoniella shivajii TaxID=564305 RepID=A0ABZ1D925_9TREE|nr:hypothetical protein IL334_006131 [Kwoniella shivajii]
MANLTSAEYVSGTDTFPRLKRGSYDDVEGGVIVDAAGDGYTIGEDRKTIGLTSAIFLLVNRMISTGIFTTSSAIFVPHLVQV